MYKIMETRLLGVVAGIILLAGFWLFALPVWAGDIEGSVGTFVHNHMDGCYEEVVLSCESLHVETHKVDQGAYHCEKCNGETIHHIVEYTGKCPVKNTSWQKEGYTACNVCGNYYTKWSRNTPLGHIYTEQQLKCSLAEGEPTATVKIVADDSWTNQGVKLDTTTNVLKQDLSSDGIVVSWTDGTLYATENGTYSVTATNAQGNTVSSSISISCIDKTTPVIKSIAGNETTMTDKKIEVTVSAEDGESGLAEAAYSTDGGSTWGTASTFWVEEGKSLQLAVRDKAGNISRTTISRNQFPYPPKPVSPESPAVASPQQTTASPAVTPSGQTPAPAVRPQEPVVEKQEVSTSPPPAMKSSADAAGKGEKTLQAEKDVLTEAEREQAYGISVILQKRARDEFFMKSKVKMPTEEATEESAEEAGVENVAKEKDAVVFITPMEEGRMTDAGNEKIALLNRLKQNAGTYFGTTLCIISSGLFVYLLWLHSAVLYCYEGGEEYRKIGIFRIKRGKKELELYLPDYILQSTKAFRYRLMLRSPLVKKCANHDLVVYNEDNKLRQQVEECVDFVL